MTVKLRVVAVGAALVAATWIFASCGADDDKDEGNDKTGELSFDTDIAPIIAASCSGSGCHSSGSPYRTYVGNEANVKASAADIKTRLGLPEGNSQKMPLAPSTISGANKSTLLTYLDQ